MTSTWDGYYDDEEYCLVIDSEDDSNTYFRPRLIAHLGRQLEGACVVEEPFTTLSTTEVLERLRRDVEKANEIFGLTPEAALLVLRCYGWNVDDSTLERYLNESDIINKELKITDAVGGDDCAGSALVRSEEPMECPICGDNVPAGRSVALASCRHFLCVDCLTSNIRCAVKHGHDLIDKRCPIGQCCNILGLGVFEKLLPPKEYSQVQRRFLNDYISSHTHMCCCPNEASCEGIILITALREFGPDVCCLMCGLEFCFKCLQPPHTPATCDMLRRWVKMLQENEPSLALIETTTKGCPNCSVRVEKNKGCNHMKCVHCKHEYCWVCLGPWTEHNGEYYTCGKKEDEENKNEGNLFLNCYERWHNHKQSLLLETKMLEADSQYLQAFTQCLKETPMFGKTLEVLLDTQRVLHNSRLMLMHGYIALYFGGLTRTSFHYRIHQLELRTEETSRLIDAPPELLHVESLQNCAAQAAHWCRVLQREGLDC